MLKITLLYLETDIKAENQVQQKQLNSIIERDSTLAEEDVLVAFDIEKIKQLKNEKLKERIKNEIRERDVRNS